MALNTFKCNCLTLLQFEGLTQPQHYQKAHYSAPVGVQSIAINPSVCLYVSVCLSARISLEPLDQLSQNFMCRSPVAVARSSSGGIALHYVLPFLWMMSHLAIMGATLKGGGCTQRW